MKTLNERLNKSQNAEEILRSVGNGIISKSVAINAMNQYAANKLVEHEAIIKELIVLVEGIQNYSCNDGYTNEKYDKIIKKARNLIYT